MKTRQVVIYTHPEVYYWIAECPSLRGCYSQGNTRDEALENIRQAMAKHIDAPKGNGHKASAEHIVTSTVFIRPG